MRAHRRVVQAIADATAWAPPLADDGSLPDIIIGVDEKRVNDEAIASLAGHPDIYRAGTHWYTSRRRASYRKAFNGQPVSRASPRFRQLAYAK